MIRSRSKVVRLIHIYSFKFQEYFGNYQSGFFQSIWGMICNNQVNSSKANEKLVKEVVKYMSEMAGQSTYADFFKNNMLPIFQQIIIPNVSVSE